MTTKSILDFWPFDYPPRKSQVEALTWLEKNWKDNPNIKYMILELPVGAGKSNIGLTFSNFVGQRKPGVRGDSFILTPQKILQEQYENSFRGIASVNMASFYGKSNYSCNLKRTTCDVGSIVKPECPSCPFKLAKNAARKAANTVLNYKLALLSFAYTNTFKDPRELLILDECHNLEEQLVSFDAVTVSELRCKKYKINWQQKKTLKEAVEWIKEKYIPKIIEAVEDLEYECEALLEKGDLNQAEIKKLKELSALTDHRDEVNELIANELDYLNQHFVLVSDKITMTFKRLYGSYAFRRIVEPKARRFLFMSSTVLDKDGFCRDLGIEPSEAAFLSLPSEFPVENRPVTYMPQMKMNVDWKSEDRENERKTMLKTIKELLELHKGESGIVHTGNFQIAQWLVEELEYTTKHRIYHHNPGSGDQRGAVIQAFMGDPKPSLLISPSITEGLDLKDDLARFALFCKVPFGNLGDAWIKRRMELSSEWYQRQALIDMIQGGGRVVRTPTDIGHVYILDASFGYLYKQTYTKIPKWWRDAYKAI
jgi:Rad3-related DNA helicase